MAKRKVKKSTKSTRAKTSKVAKTTKRKSTTRRKQPRNPFEIGTVRTLI